MRVREREKAGKHYQAKHQIKNKKSLFLCADKVLNLKYVHFYKMKCMLVLGMLMKG